METTLKANAQKSATGLFLRELFTNFDLAGIRYCVLRGYDGLPDHVQHDVDLLVSDGSFPKVRKAIQGTAEILGWKIIKESSRFSIRQHILYIENSEKGSILLQMDFWAPTTWRGMVTAHSDKVLKSHKIYNGIRVASHGSEAAISLFKEYLCNGKVKDLGDGRHKKRISVLVQEDPENFVVAVEPYFGKDVAMLALTCARNEDWETLESKIGLVRRALIVRAIIRKPVGQVINWCRFFWGHISDKLINPSGIFVCFIGPDGSGKTTASQAIKRDMKYAFSDVLYYHGHLGILPELKVFYNMVASVLNRTRKKAESNENTTSSEAEVVGRLKAVVYMLYYSMDYCLGHFLIRRAKGQGKLVLFDRYFYDYYINGTHRKIPEWLFKLISYLIPKPDLVIWLKADPAAIYKRKPELSVEQIKWQNRRCHRLTEFLRSAVSVKSDEGPEVVLAGFHEAIVAAMSGRIK